MNDCRYCDCCYDYRRCCSYYCCCCSGSGSDCTKMIENSSCLGLHSWIEMLSSFRHGQILDSIPCSHRKGTGGVSISFPSPSSRGKGMEDDETSPSCHVLNSWTEMLHSFRHGQTLGSIPCSRRKGTRSVPIASPSPWIRGKGTGMDKIHPSSRLAFRPIYFYPPFRH